MTHSKNVVMLRFAGYTIKHSGECYTNSKDGDIQGKHNTYHSTLDSAVVHLAEARIPEKVAEKGDYHASLAELVEIVREVRSEIVSALSMAGIGGRSPNSEKRHPDIAEGEKPPIQGVGA